MSIASIVKDAKTKVTEMGGGEQFLGTMFDLAESCGIADASDLIVDLGEALEKENLQLISGPGKPQDLYARPLEA